MDQPELRLCKICKKLPELDDDGSWEPSYRLQCRCLSTRWFPSEVYDRKRADTEGQHSEYSGSYFPVEWKSPLYKLWNTLQE